MELGLRKFTETDYMGFAGVESANPLIAEVTLGKSEITVIIDGLATDVVIITEDGYETVTDYIRTFTTEAERDVFIILLPAILTDAETLITGLTVLGFNKISS